MKKLITILTFTLFSDQLYSQKTEFVDLIFEKKDDLEFIQAVDSKIHSNFYLLSQTSPWLADRFKLRSNSKGYYDTSELYFFSDSTIANISSDMEKRNLAEQANILVSRALTNTYKTIKIVDTLNKPNNSYVYQITDPIYTSDSAFAFIDAAVYYPNETDKFFNEAYEAQVMFIFRRSQNSGWILFNKKVKMMLW